MNFEFAKVREVKSPVRGTEKSIGIDFFVPEFTEQFVKDLKEKNPDVSLLDNKMIQLMPQQHVLIPSGIKVKLPDNTFMNAFNKSGVSSKKHLIKMAETVDEDYQGEVHISILNAGRKIQNITEHEKLVQFIILPAIYTEIVEKNKDVLYNNVTERGEGGFGSTNKGEINK
jgi:deoxyuridine 5'-triphosphate nucleotidohydrolase